MQKKHVFIILCVALLGMLFSACDKDFLNLTNPNQMTTDSYWRNAEDVEDALTGTYALLQHQWWEWYWAPGEMFMTLEVQSDLTATENLFYPLGSGGHDSYNYTDNMYTTRHFWRTLYMQLFAANQVIENTPNVSDLTDAEKNAYIAEAKFLRGFAHFELLKLYGNIILVTETPADPEAFYKEQSPAADVWAQIEADFTDAKEHLPVMQPDARLGAATKGAAAAFLGKAYLYQKKWAQAETEFAAVTGMGYNLVATEEYHSLFTGLNEHSVESIFEINFSADRPGGRIESQSIVPNYNDWLGILPSDHLKELFENDVTANGDPSPRKLASVVFDHPDSDIWYFEGGSFEDYYGADETRIFYKKYNYYDENNDPYWYASVGTNFILMRYADVLLMLAEAQNELGNTSSATANINLVRARAGVPNIDAGMSQADVRHHIREVERPLELCNEMGRFFDLVRWYKDEGGVQAALQANNAPNADSFIDGVNEIWPITIREIQANPNIVQNPGY